MKKLLKPIDYIILKFGSLVRTIWNGKKFTTYGLIKTSEIENAVKKNRLYNRITGSTILTLLLSAWGIYVSITPTDLDKLKVSMETSLDKIEQLDYLSAGLDSSFNNSQVYECNLLRGRCKVVLNMMNASNKMFLQDMEWFFSIDNNDSIDKALSALFTSYKSLIQYSDDFNKDFQHFYREIQVKKIMDEIDDTIVKGGTIDINNLLNQKYNTTYSLVDSLFLAKLNIASWKNKNEMDIFAGYLSNFIIEYDRIGKGNSKTLQKKKARLLKDFIKSEERIHFDLSLYEYTEMVYEYLITKQIDEIYRK